MINSAIFWHFHVQGRFELLASDGEASSRWFGIPKGRGAWWWYSSRMLCIHQCNRATEGRFRFLTLVFLRNFGNKSSPTQPWSASAWEIVGWQEVFWLFKGRGEAGKPPGRLHTARQSKSLHAVSTSVTWCSCAAFIGGKHANNRVIHPLAPAPTEHEKSLKYVQNPNGQGYECVLEV